MEDAEWQFEEMQMLGFDSSITIMLETQPIQDSWQFTRKGCARWGYRSDGAELLLVN